LIHSDVDNPKSIKYYIKRYLTRIRHELEHQVVVDIPAGNGATSDILASFGAEVKAFDLFPEYFRLKHITCTYADIAEGVPLADHSADMLICQEGIEHFSDQLAVLKEFNRLLKHNARLLITTPSYSNLAAKMSYLLFESESFNQMPPNEINDIWMADTSGKPRLYHGHIFLLGLQKLRILGRLAGFRIEEVFYVRMSLTSLALFPIFYPFILIRSWLTYRSNMAKNKGVPSAQKRKVYREQLRLNIHPKHLLNKHTFVIFRKETDARLVDFRQDDIIKPFDRKT